MSSYTYPGGWETLLSPRFPLTVESVMALGPCPQKYPEEVVRRLFYPKDVISVEEALQRKDVPPLDRMWLILQPGVLPLHLQKSIVSEFSLKRPPEERESVREYCRIEGSWREGVYPWSFPPTLYGVAHRALRNVAEEELFIEEALQAILDYKDKGDT
jgi:hypothetical protein